MVIPIDQLFFKPLNIKNVSEIPSIKGFYSVVVITFGFDPDNPGSNPGKTLFLYIFS